MKMKKFVFVLLVVFGVAKITFAQSENDFEVEQLPDNTIRIVAYNGSLTDIVIPDTMYGLKVTVIGNKYHGALKIGDYEGAFSRKGIKSVVIPDTVTIIEDSAFLMNNIKAISLPKSLKRVGHYAFCYNPIQTLIVPEGVTYIGSYAFGDYDGSESVLNELVLPASLTKRELNQGISSTSFYGCPLNKITLPANMDEGNLGSFETGFVNFWKSQNKSAGIYIKKGPIWGKQ
jgi:hypothetical protein